MPVLRPAQLIAKVAPRNRNPSRCVTEFLRRDRISSTISLTTHQRWFGFRAPSSEWSFEIASRLGEPEMDIEVSCATCRHRQLDRSAGSGAIGNRFNQTAPDALSSRCLGHHQFLEVRDESVGKEREQVKCERIADEARFVIGNEQICLTRFDELREVTVEECPIGLIARRERHQQAEQ